MFKLRQVEKDGEDAKNLENQGVKTVVTMKEKLNIMRERSDALEVRVEEIQRLETYFEDSGE